MTLSRDESDQTLMQALAEGTDDALNRLMDAWSAPLIAYLTRLTGSAATAEDLAQETFVRVYRHRLDFTPGKKFSTWLFAIATNLARNHARWRERHPETLLQHDEMASLPVKHDAPAPDEQTQARERLAAVQKAIAALPQDMREMLILSTWHGMSHEEIARVQGSSLKAVELRLYRARKQLRAELSSMLPEA